LCGTVIEPDAPRKVEPHNADDVLDLEGVGEERMPHVPTGRVMQFDLLQVELRVRQPVEITDMVVMHVGEHDILDGAAVDADERERLDWAAQNPRLAAAATAAVKPVSMTTV